MTKIGLFYGSTTDKTETVAEAIQEALGGEDVVAVHEIADVTYNDFADYDCIIIACNTWNTVGLQADWEGFYDDNLDSIDFSGNKVAYFGTLNEDNQSELTDERIQKWTTQLKSEFAL